jgi:hypothetical protein
MHKEKTRGWVSEQWVIKQPLGILEQGNCYRAFKNM